MLSGAGGGVRALARNILSENGRLLSGSLGLVPSPSTGEGQDGGESGLGAGVRRRCLTTPVLPALRHSPFSPSFPRKREPRGARQGTRARGGVRWTGGVWCRGIPLWVPCPGLPTANSVPPTPTPLPNPAHGELVEPALYSDGERRGETPLPRALARGVGVSPTASRVGGWEGPRTADANTPPERSGTSPATCTPPTSPRRTSRRSACRRRVAAT